MRPGFTLTRQVLRAQAVRLNLSALSPDTARLALFDDVELPVRWTRTETIAPASGGGQVWFGAVENTGMGEATMVVQGNMVAANFTGNQWADLPGSDNGRRADLGLRSSTRAAFPRMSRSRCFAPRWPTGPLRSPIRALSDRR